MAISVKSEGIGVFALSLSTFVGSGLLPAVALPSVDHWLSPQQDQYLNESQDRTIKKRTFKADEFPSAEPIVNRDSGLFAIVDTGLAEDERQIIKLLSDPRVNGLSCSIPWQKLEPKEDQYDWQPVERLLQPCQKVGKTLIVRVSTCGPDLDSTDTPSWVFTRGAKSIKYGSVDGKDLIMPVCWDPIYLAKWSNFVTAFGKRYDGNSHMHSIGITGGGVAGGTAIVPEWVGSKDQRELLNQMLTEKFGMDSHQIVQHWINVGDIFAGAFAHTHLDFDVTPPLEGRRGQSALDEICNYLINRYGARVYLTRQHVENGSNGYDQYRQIVKFRDDTLTGARLAADFPPAALEKLVKSCFEDGISFLEMPLPLLDSKDRVVSDALNQLRAHLGSQLIVQKIDFPSDIKSGAPLKVKFSIANCGAATPLRPIRKLDKDVAGSYKVQLELCDAGGKPVAVSLHTPGIPTNKWEAGTPIVWQEELKMPKLEPGKYSIWMSFTDAEPNHKLRFLLSSDLKHAASSIEVGSIIILSDSN